MGQLKVLTKLQGIRFLVFLFHVFFLSVTLSINTRKSSKVFMNLIMLFISSFRIIKINSFPVLTAVFPIIFLSNLYTAFEGKLFTSPSKLSLAKGIVTSIITNLSKLPNQEPKDLSNVKFYTCSRTDSKTFLVLVICLVVINNSLDNSFYSWSSLFIFNIASVILFYSRFEFA